MSPFLVFARVSHVCLRSGVVLEIKFPSGIQMMFDFLSLLAINLKSILQVECLGNLSFCAPPASQCDWLC